MQLGKKPAGDWRSVQWTRCDGEFGEAMSETTYGERWSGVEGVGTERLAEKGNIGFERSYERRRGRGTAGSSWADMVAIRRKAVGESPAMVQHGSTVEYRRIRGEGHWWTAARVRAEEESKNAWTYKRLQSMARQSGPALPMTGEATGMSFSQRLIDTRQIISIAHPNPFGGAAQHGYSTVLSS